MSVSPAPSRTSVHGEKEEIAHVEDTNIERGGNDLSPEDASWLASFPESRKKAVVRKIDIRLVPLLTFLYLFSFIDRANIGNAKIEGLEDDLKITPQQYNIALSVFFIPYIVFEVPSNYILTKFKKPSTYIGGIIVAWGTVMTLMGIVQNFGGLVAARFMLGVTEAGFFPGAVYIISQWYLPNEIQTRIAIFYSASALAGAISGLLAFAIARMDGVGGLNGWRWIFLLEGIATVLAGLLCFFFLIDSPETSAWLEDDEVRFLRLRRLAQVGMVQKKKTAGKKTVEWKILRSVLTDWQIYFQALIYISSTVPNYGMKFTMPQIIKNMGYKSSNAQLLTIPPYCAGAISAFLSAMFADRFTWRMPFIVGPLSVLVTALAILFSFSSDVKGHVAAMYVGVVLAQIGTYPLLPGISSWIGNNLAPSWKRSIGLAWLLAAGNIGSLIGTNIFLDREGPRYPTGYGTSLGIICLAMVVACVLEFCFWTMNKAKSRIPESEVREKYTQEQLDGMGEKSPLFQYML
ncbi:hypothetical protein VUR80DRAFT_5922 [Thermomyces stellatus]